MLGSLGNRSKVLSKAALQLREEPDCQGCPSGLSAQRARQTCPQLQVSWKASRCPASPAPLSPVPESGHLQRTSRPCPLSPSIHPPVSRSYLTPLKSPCRGFVPGFSRDIITTSGPSGIACPSSPEYPQRWGQTRIPDGLEAGRLGNGTRIVSLQTCPRLISRLRVKVLPRH